MSDVPHGRRPAWVVHVVVGLGGALAVAGAILLATGGRMTPASERVVLSAIVLPGLLAPVQLLGLRRRADRARARLYHDLGAVESLLAAERDLPLPDRPAGACDAQLTAVADAVGTTRSQVSSSAPAADVAACVDRVVELTRGWPAGSALAQAVARCRSGATRLTRVSRRTDLVPALDRSNGGEGDQREP